MIRLHEFNSTWWGAPTGIVDDAAFFDLPEEQQKKELSEYRWVEFKSKLDGATPLRAIARAGFFMVDTQVAFRIALKPVTGACANELTVRSARDAGFSFHESNMAPFERERYAYLPGCTTSLINERYAMWARSMIRDRPDTCLAVSAGEEVQGWFFSQATPSGLDLTLAVSSRNAKVSGLLLYQACLSAYERAGHRIGFASFSIRNSPVHNIYANLGARFTSSMGIWLWVASEPSE